ncbi:hypothetical protein M1N21_00290 [Dehalococcoidia bacterium]|nr:hypothetical protein [Dehalococcoidia bacterium]
MESFEQVAGILQDVLRNKITDPLFGQRPNGQVEVTEEFTAQANSAFTLSHKLVRNIKQVLVGDQERFRWVHFDVSFDDPTDPESRASVIFQQGYVPIIGQKVTITYSYGRNHWIYTDYPEDEAVFPRISITMASSPGAKPVGLGDYIEGGRKAAWYSHTCDISVWTQRGTTATVDGERMSWQRLARYLAHQVRSVLEENRNILFWQGLVDPPREVAFNTMIEEFEQGGKSPGRIQVFRIQMMYQMTIEVE